MALRVLSGMLQIEDGPKSGSATISYLPFALTDAPDSVSLIETRIIGPAGAFAHPPAAIVASRQFRLMAMTDRPDFRITINDEVRAGELQISWSGGDASFSEEIPFLLVGEVNTGFFGLFRRLFGSS